jgi:hypothetical protein
MTKEDADTPENADIVAAANDLKESLQGMSESLDEFSAVMTDVAGDAADSTAGVGEASSSPEDTPTHSMTANVADD